VIPEKCSHCGRENCRKLGDDECQAARERMFEEMRTRIRAQFDKRYTPQHSEGK
jgi:hypothetical protein